MSTLYWINVIGNLNALFIALIIATITLSCFYSIFADHPRQRVYCIAVTITLLSVLGLVFIPSKQDLYVIYGVGGTLDYLHDNKDAKQIPDKCLKVLNEYLDQHIDGNKNKEK